MILTKKNEGRELASTLIAVLIAIVAVIGLREVLLVYTQLDTPLVIIHGHSMYPFFLDGDIVVIISPSKTIIEKGDIVVYKSPSGYLVIHRVIEKKVKGNKTIYFITKGDNNALPDFPQIGFSEIKGVVVAASINTSSKLKTKLVFKVPVLGGIFPTLSR